MKKRLFFALCLLGGLVADVFGQDKLAYSMVSIPEGLRKNACAIIRKKEVKLSIDRDLDLVADETLVVTILNGDGNYFENCVEYEDQSRDIKKMEGRVYGPLGNLIKESSKSDIIAYSPDDSGEFTKTTNKRLRLTHNTYPFTVEFHTITKTKDFFMLYPQTVQYLGVATEHFDLSLEVPADMNFKWRATNCKTEPVERTEKGIKTWAVSMRNLPAPPQEPYMPFFGGDYATIELLLERIQMGEYKGDMRNWASVGRFFYEMNKDRDQLSPAMQEQVQAMVANAKTNREKIGLLYEYLQQNHRYISIQLGIGGFQTLPASFVEQKRMGDCKALSNYLKAMLKVAGIEAYLAPIYGNSEGYPELSDDFSNPRFNHMVLYVPSEKLWIECTANKHPLGHMGDFTAGHPALLLTPEGGQLVQVPLPDATENQRKMRMEIMLDATGNATVDARQAYTGLLYDNYRYLVTEKDQSARDQAYGSTLGVSVSAYDKLTFEAEKGKTIAHVQARFDTRGMAKVNGKRCFITINKIKPFKTSLPADSSRVHALKLSNANVLLDTLVFNVPEGYTIETAPKPAHFESDFIEYDLSVGQLDGQRFTVVRRIVERPILAKPERYSEIRQLLADIKKIDGAQVVLKKE
jgi:hypothetical protein